MNKEENSYWGKSKENVNRGKEGKIQKGRETKRIDDRSCLPKAKGVSSIWKAGNYFWRLYYMIISYHTLKCRDEQGGRSEEEGARRRESILPSRKDVYPSVGEKDMKIKRKIDKVA